MNKSIIRQIDQGTTKAEEGVKTLKKRLKRTRLGIKGYVVAISLGVGLTGAVSGLCFYNVSQWYDKNKVDFQAPVIVRPPVLISKREGPKTIVITPEPKVDEKTAQVNEIYHKIRYMESTAGMNSKDQTATHNYCQSVGKVNEIGYLVDGNRKFCFADYGEQWETIKKWFTKRLATMSEDEALCLWNTGLRQPQCLYSMKYHSL